MYLVLHIYPGTNQSIIRIKRNIFNTFVFKTKKNSLSHVLLNNVAKHYHANEVTIYEYIKNLYSVKFQKIYNNKKTLKKNYYYYLAIVDLSKHGLSLFQNFKKLNPCSCCHTSACYGHFFHIRGVHLKTFIVTLIRNFPQHSPVSLHCCTGEVRMWAGLRLTVLTPASCFRHCYGDSCLIHGEFDVPWTAGPEHHGKRTGVQLGRARAVAKQSGKLLVWFVTDGAPLHLFKLWNNVEGHVRFSWIISQLLFYFPVWNLLARTSYIHCVARYQENKHVYQNLKNKQKIIHIIYLMYLD